MSVSLKKSFCVSSLKEYKTVFDYVLDRKVDLFLLKGDLGAGKTTFVGQFLNYVFSSQDLSQQGFMSPTFSVINQYELLNETITHADLYRLNSDEIEELDLAEMMEDSRYTFIEWYEKSENLISFVSKEKVIIEILKTPDNKRTVNLYL